MCLLAWSWACSLYGDTALADDLTAELVVLQFKGRNDPKGETMDWERLDKMLDDVIEEIETLYDLMGHEKTKLIHAENQVLYRKAVITQHKTKTDKLIQLKEALFSMAEKEPTLTGP